MFAATSIAVILAVVAVLLLVRGSAKRAFAASGSLNLVYVESNVSGSNGTCTTNCTSVVG